MLRLQASAAAIGLKKCLPLRTLAAWSNLAGGLVCEQVGVVPVDKEQLTREAERLAL